MSEAAEVYGEPLDQDEAVRAAGDMALRLADEPAAATTAAEDANIWKDDGSAPLTADPVRQYYDQIGRNPLINAAREVELSKRIEAGLFAARILRHARGDTAGPAGTPKLEETLERRKPEADSQEWRDLAQLAHDGAAAKREMLEANLRLVVSIAKRYTGRGMQMLDLIQEGNLGLIRAVEKFDYTKGYKFSTYATWWIRQAITRGMADQARTIRLPAHMVEQINKMGRINRELTHGLGRTPSVEELAEEMGVKVERAQELIDQSREPVSLDKLVGDQGDGIPLGDRVGDGDEPQTADIVGYSDMAGQLRQLLHGLTEREQQVVLMRYGFSADGPMTLDNIGKALGVTRERIRQIEAKAMKKLQGIASGEYAGLREYLD